MRDKGAFIPGQVKGTQEVLIGDAAVVAAVLSAEARRGQGLSLRRCHREAQVVGVQGPMEGARQDGKQGDRPN